MWVEGKGHNIYFASFKLGESYTYDFIFYGGFVFDALSPAHLLWEDKCKLLCLYFYFRFLRNTLFYLNDTPGKAIMESDQGSF